MVDDREYAMCVSASERACWSLDEAVSKLDFDFSRRFVPPKIVGANTIDFLDDQELRLLNQIRGFSYSHLFLFVEEYIIIQVLEQSKVHIHSSHDATRALLRFAEEETKHQALFRAVKARLSERLGPCDELGGMREVAELIVSKPPLAVMLLTLMLEWITQSHYLECFKGNRDLDPAFSEIFRLHWLEEAQHARLDTLEIKFLCANASPGERDAGVDVLIELIAALDGLLRQQAELDVRTFERVGKRTLSDAQRVQLVDSQHAALRWTFITSGLEHRIFRRAVSEVSKTGANKLQEIGVKYAS